MKSKKLITAKQKTPEEKKSKKEDDEDENTNDSDNTIEAGVDLNESQSDDRSLKEIQNEEREEVIRKEEEKKKEIDLKDEIENNLENLDKKVEKKIESKIIVGENKAIEGEKIKDKKEQEPARLDSNNKQQIQTTTTTVVSVVDLFKLKSEAKDNSHQQMTANKIPTTVQILITKPSSINLLNNNTTISTTTTTTTTTSQNKSAFFPLARKICLPQVKPLINVNQKCLQQTNDAVVKTLQNVSLATTSNNNGIGLSLPKPIPINSSKLINSDKVNKTFTPIVSTSLPKPIPINSSKLINSNKVNKTFTPIVSPVINLNQYSPNLIKNNLTNLSSTSIEKIKVPSFIKSQTPLAKSMTTTVNTNTNTVSSISTLMNKQIKSNNINKELEIRKLNNNDSLSFENDKSKPNQQPQFQLNNFKETSNAILQAKQKNIRRISPPPIFWQKHNHLIDQVIVTDVKSDDISITIRESKTMTDFFKKAQSSKKKKKDLNKSLKCLKK